MKVYTKDLIKEKKDKEQNRKKILRIILIPVALIFIAISIYIGYQKIILKNDNIDILGCRTYIVLTGSMKPTINPNDLIFVKKISEDNIKVGDIITYKIKENSAPVTHRITKILNEDGKTIYKTKGDNNNSEDLDNIEYSQIQGVYLFKIDKIGSIIATTFTGTGFIILVIILILSYHHSNNKEDRRLTREEARKKYNVCKYNKGDSNDKL